MNEGIIACHVCDVLCSDRILAPGERMRCPRCKAVLRTSRAAAADKLLSLALAVPPLMLVGLLTPFLSLTGGGLYQEASVLDAARAVGTTGTWYLALAVGVMIVALPTLRALALCYVLLPVRLGYAPARNAKLVFRLAIGLRPWSMAEVFMIGVAVALVKLSGLASIVLGPAFWSFVVLGIVVMLEDAVLCRRSVWDSIV